MTTEATALTKWLGPLERRVMAQLWSRGPQTVGEMLDAVNDGSFRPLAYTTVMTILVRLHEKGYLARNREARHYRYAAVVDESGLTAHAGRLALRRLIDGYGADSVARFATDLGEGDLARRLRSLARTGRSET